MAVMVEKQNPKALSESEMTQVSYEQSRVEEYLLRNVSALKEWIKSHPNQKPPVYYRQEDDKVVWVNRAERRELVKSQANKTRMVKPQPKNKTRLSEAK